MRLELLPYDAARHLDACLDIWHRASLAGHAFLGEEAIAADLALVREVYMPKAEVIVAEVDGETAGFIALLDGFIGGLFVDPGRHRGGIGRALVGSAGSRRGTLAVEVYERNAKAVAFYRACGFVDAGKRPTDDLGRPFALLRMERRSDGRHIDGVVTRQAGG